MFSLFGKGCCLSSMALLLRVQNLIVWSLNKILHQLPFHNAFLSFSFPLSVNIKAQVHPGPREGFCRGIEGGGPEAPPRPSSPTALWASPHLSACFLTWEMAMTIPSVSQDF